MISTTSGWTALARVLVLAAALSSVGVCPTSAASVSGRPAKTAAPDKLSQQLCDALQTLPEKRKAQCCATAPSGGLAGECARQLRLALQAGTLTLDAADVDRCTADSTRALEGCDWVTPYLPATPASCRGLLHGRLDAGASCGSSVECRDGLSCRGGGPTGGGICAAPGGPGASCGGGLDTLATFARQTEDPRHPECAGFCLRGRCTALVAVGGECSGNQQCAAGSHCAARRCIEGPRPALGEACSDTTCADALVCIDGRCAPAKKAGESCTHPFECEASCLSRGPDRPGTCGMKCSAWPPAGYTQPVAPAIASPELHSERSSSTDRRLAD